MSYKDCVHNYNLATECGLTTEMTELEICTAIAEWVNSTIDYMTAEVVETVEDTCYIVQVYLNTFSNVKACWGTSTSTSVNMYYRCRLLYNDITYNSAASGTATTVAVYSVPIANIGSLNFYIVKSAQGCIFGFYNRDYSRETAVLALVSTLYNGDLIGVGLNGYSSNLYYNYVVKKGDTAEPTRYQYVLPIAESDTQCLTRLIFANTGEVAQYLYLTNDTSTAVYTINGRYFVNFNPTATTGYMRFAMEIVEGDNDVLYKARE